MVLTEIIMPFRKSDRDKILAGVKTATTRKTKYGFADDTFMVGEAECRITEVHRLSLISVAKDWFREEGFRTPEDFVESWLVNHPRIGYSPGRMVFVHVFELVKK